MAQKMWEEKHYDMASGDSSMGFELDNHPNAPHGKDGMPPIATLHIESPTLRATTAILYAIQDEKSRRNFFDTGILNKLSEGGVIPETEEYASLRAALPYLDFDTLRDDQEVFQQYERFLEQHTKWVKLYFDVEINVVEDSDAVVEYRLVFTTRTPGMLTALRVMQEASTEDNIQTMMLENMAVDLHQLERDHARKHKADGE